MTCYRKSGSLLYLPAFYDFLVENSKLIADPIAICSQAQGCHRIQEASWKPRGQYIPHQCKQTLVYQIWDDHSSLLCPLSMVRHRAFNLPARRPKPPLPRPASSSISWSSSISKPICKIQLVGQQLKKKMTRISDMKPARLRRTGWGGSPGTSLHHKHSPAQGSPWCSAASGPCRTPRRCSIPANGDRDVKN